MAFQHKSETAFLCLIWVQQQQTRVQFGHEAPKAFCARSHEGCTRLARGDGWFRCFARALLHTSMGIPEELRLRMCLKPRLRLGTL